jgi:hypothetical protein
MRLRRVRATIPAAATVVLVVVAVGLPLRAEWHRYRAQVPPSPLTTAEPRSAVTFADIRWQLDDYDRVRSLPIDPVEHRLLLRKIEPPRGRNESWVQVTVRARSLSRQGDANEIAFHLRDTSGRTWTAATLAGTIAGSRDPETTGKLQVVGVVPTSVADKVQLQVAVRPSFWIGSPPPEVLGGPLLLFDR